MAGERSGVVRTWRGASGRALGRRLHDLALTETVRSSLGGAVGITLGVSGHATGAGGPWTLVDGLLVGMAAYQVLYVLLTLAIYLPAGPEVVARAAASMPRRGPLHRWLLLTEPGAGAALAVGLGAMVTAVVVLPQSGGLPSGLPQPALVAVGIVLVVSAWATMVVTYAIDYLRRDLLDGGLRFAGDEPRVFADYLYVAVAVATTFGTTDVEVTRSALRRTVTGHALAAFVFNAVVVAISVASIVSLAT
ncbi:DUF1345 domain-containing protein [Cellulomonas sp. zg-ZUI222]|uniref:DUF1345 domain-containing protein n=1 Tax=Cellulomonas wangleii TaxID=2816956 RepID=UPI001A95271F|nr:DUF1345 domain-containing protein [Cellulomonas wangleii]MBO0919405.1 DUF1345 domain-containing protein [Cellulomonas wangleii]